MLILTYIPQPRPLCILTHKEERKLAERSPIPGPAPAPPKKKKRKKEKLGEGVGASKLFCMEESHIDSRMALKAA